MNDTPISGPDIASRTHHARDASSSRHSFSRSQTKGPLRKRKEQILEVQWVVGVRGAQARGQLLDGAFRANAAGAEEHETIAHARRVADLMDGQEQRASGGGVLAQRRAHLARLPQIEAVERLVAQ